MGRRMNRWFLLSGAFLHAAAVLSCAARAKQDVYPPRFVERATRERVFNESLQAVTAIAGAARVADIETGYIRSVSYPPPPRFMPLYRKPTRFVLEVRIRGKKEKGKTFHVPEFTLSAIQSPDWGRSWKRISPPRSYKDFIENHLRKRVITIVAGYYANVLTENEYLGFIVLKNDTLLFKTAEKKTVAARARKFQFGELQFGPRCRPATLYKNGLLYVKLWTPDQKKVEGWMDENAVKIFMFTFNNTAGTPEVFRLIYRREFIRAVSRNIGLIKGVEAGWPGKVMDAVRRGEVIDGMTEEQVVSTLGPPQETEHLATGTGEEVLVYVYKDVAERVQKRIHFLGGRVVKIGQ